MNKYLSVNEIRKIQKELLQYLIKRCEKLNIPCFLAGGTLIGAIRHKGYIPWDDDIDVLMFHDDYLKLVASFEEKIDKNYEILDGTVKPGYSNIICKLHDKRTQVEETDGPTEWGIFIDIFLLDGVGRSLEQAIEITKKAEFYHKCFYVSLPNKKLSFKLKELPKWPIIIICRMLGRKFFYRKLLKLSQKYTVKDSKYVAAMFNGVQGLKEINPKYVFMDTIKAPFEELSCYVPRGYDTYLSNLYGNYMELPPVEKRKAPHELKAWWK